MKLAIQLPVHVYWQTLGEALVLCRSLGVDPDLLVDIFGDTPGASNVIKERAGAIASALRGEANLREGATRPAAFDIDAIRKDLRTMILEAESLGFDSPLASASLKGFDLASVEGFGHLSAAAFTKFWIDRSPTLDPSGRDQGQKQV
jgi:3-hydroxyisobutyrate dehydrogenase